MEFAHACNGFDEAQGTTRIGQLLISLQKSILLNITIILNAADFASGNANNLLFAYSTFSAAACHKAYFPLLCEIRTVSGVT